MTRSYFIGRLAAAGVWLAAACATADARNVQLVPPRTAWRYMADGSDPGTSWRDRIYNDELWPIATAEIGYGDGDEVSLLPAATTPRPITTYFRRHFHVPPGSAFTTLFLRLVCDDGAIVYLNGFEVFRSGLPEGAITSTAPALAEAEYPGENNYVLARLPATALVSGDNLVAVEIHQGAAESPDMSFDLELVASPKEAAAFLTRGPYLQNATPSQVTIRWRTDVPTGSHVRIGRKVETQTQRFDFLEETTEHEMTLTGLTARTRYFYTVGDGVADLGGGDSAHSFQTAPPIGNEEPLRIWVIGDCGTGRSGAGHAELVRDAYLRSPLFSRTDVWLMLGDNAYNVGTDAEYQAAVFDTYPTILRDTTLWSTLGNHESYTENGAPYFNIFTLPSLGEGGGIPSGTENYYSFDYGNIHFVCLDAMLSDRLPGSPMLTWLEADLASTSQKWIIAFWHHPPFTKGSHDSDYEIELVEMREHALPILEAGGVDLVLCGHSHSYERSYLIDGHYGVSTTLTGAMIKDAGDGREEGDGAYGKDPEPKAGAVYVVAGSSGRIGGGAHNHPVMFTSLNELGSLILDVHGDQLGARFLNSQGAVRDHFSISKAPLVTLTASVPVTAEELVAPGQMTLSRTRGMESSLPVRLSMAGTAVADLDYLTLAPRFTIPAGASSVSFFIKAKLDELAEGTESVTVAVGLDVGYRIHRDSRRATVFIKDDQLEPWRVAKFGADAGNPDIAGDDADPDGDRENNAAEFIAGTEPRDGNSFFHVEVSVTADDQAKIRFAAHPFRSYSVLYTDSLQEPAWQKLVDIPAAEAREIIVSDPGSREQRQRFYRVVAPAIP